ncbi:hypothetical protein K491DRAFT_683288 [Lophiostoma macrostomum CBS 122681]|uniref:Uncharacterized protein n=1 Tax=Lophiostoma macrostomum CBS 122681 TaxID=1314788 RepID=A0A6A6SUK4_9PLEO|nr:hypothetical protein K491DRAFT_683288 [Lophiostoma macrostomum CBS 122681]
MASEQPKPAIFTTRHGNSVFTLPNELLLLISSFLPSRAEYPSPRERWNFAAAYPEIDALSDPLLPILSLEYQLGTPSSCRDDLDIILGILYEDVDRASKIRRICFRADMDLFNSVTRSPSPDLPGHTIHAKFPNAPSHWLKPKYRDLLVRGKISSWPREEHRRTDGFDDGDLLARLAVLLALAVNLIGLQVILSMGERSNSLVPIFDVLAPVFKEYQRQGHSLDYFDLVCEPPSMDFVSRPMVTQLNDVCTALAVPAIKDISIGGCFQSNDFEEWNRPNVPSQVEQIVLDGFEENCRSVVPHLLRSVVGLKVFHMKIELNHVAEFLEPLGLQFYNRALRPHINTLEDLSLTFEDEEESHPQWSLQTLGSLKAFSNLKRLQISVSMLDYVHSIRDVPENHHRDDSELHEAEQLWQVDNQLQEGREDANGEPDEEFEQAEEEAIRTNTENDFYKNQTSLTHTSRTRPLQQVLPKSLHTLVTTHSESITIFPYLNFARFLKHSKQEMYPNLRHWIDMPWESVADSWGPKKEELADALAEVGVQFQTDGSDESLHYNCVGQCDLEQVL